MIRDCAKVHHMFVTLCHEGFPATILASFAGSSRDNAPSFPRFAICTELLSLGMVESVSFLWECHKLPIQLGITIVM